MSLCALKRGGGVEGEGVAVEIEKSEGMMRQTKTTDRPTFLYTSTRRLMRIDDAMGGGYEHAL